MSKSKIINVQGRTIALISEKANDYISLWEQLNNPDFKSIEFDAFKNESRSNSFALTPQKWIDTTNAKGIIPISAGVSPVFPCY